MTQTDAWNTFFKSGSVMDYLEYKAIQNAKSPYESSTAEGNNEGENRGSDNRGTEYR